MPASHSDRAYDFRPVRASRLATDGEMGTEGSVRFASGQANPVHDLHLSAPNLDQPTIRPFA